MTNSKTYEIDRLRLYFGEPFSIKIPSINPNIPYKDLIIYQPTIGDIIDFGEKKLYSAVNIFVANSTMYRLQLWELGLDWNELSDFEVFSMLMTSLTIEDTKLLFGDVDFSKFKPMEKRMPDSEEAELVMYNAEQDIEINEEIHGILCHYIRTMFNIFPKREFAKGKATKKALIWEDRQKLKVEKDITHSSTLLPMISACLNHPGFKYKKNELREVGIVEFMDSVQRLQIYESTTALLRGMYSGFMDTSKIDKEQFNFMREISLTH